MKTCVRSYRAGLIAAILVLGLASCETTEKADKISEKADLASDRLPPQELAPGECGLFIWTADRTKKFILFTKSQDGTAVWAHEGKKVNLTRTRAEGLSSYEQYASQDFIAPDGTTLSMELTNGEDMGTGMRFPSGRLKVLQANGWEMVVPVLGLATCQVK